MLASGQLAVNDGEPHAVALERRAGSLALTISSASPGFPPAFRPRSRAEGAELDHQPQRLDRGLGVRKCASHFVGKNPNVAQCVSPPTYELRARLRTKPCSERVGAAMPEVVFVTHRSHTPCAREGLPSVR